jgi:hypothetical protein
VRFAISIFLMGLLVLVGCGRSDAPSLVGTKGLILYKGKPLTGATVTMVSEKGVLSNGFTGTDGRFRMTTGGRPGVPVGTARVGVVKMGEGGQKVDLKALKPENMMELQKAGKGVAKDLSPKSEIPTKYNNPDKSNLTAAILTDASKNDFEFDLVE